MTDPDPPPRPPAGRTFPRADQLLQQVIVRPLDPGYRERSLGATTRSRRRTLVTVVVVVGLVVVGVGVGSAAGQLRSVPAAASSRRALEEQIERRTSLADATAEQNAEQRSRIEALQARALEGENEGLAAAVRRLGATSGAIAVAGPGVTVTLDDSPEAAQDVFADPAAAATKRVLDIDVVNVVNGLWAVGADAIAVNGQRLTSLSPIRGAGTAILVDNRPLARPYVVEAVGDPRRLREELSVGPTGSFLSQLQSNYGIEVSVDVADDDLVLPATSSVRLEHARPYVAAPPAAATEGVSIPE